MTDQDPEDEMDTQPVTENLSDTQELTDFSRYERTDETSTRCASGHDEDKEDPKENTLTSQTGIKSQTRSRLSQAEEHRDDTKQHTEVEIKNRVAVSYPEMSRVTPEHRETDGRLENINTATEASQTAEPSQEADTEELARGGSDSSNFTVMLFGNTSAVHFGDENILLQAEHVPLDQAHIPRKREVSGRVLSVISILDLHEGDLYLDHVDHITGQIVNENHIQCFIFVLKLGQFTDDDLMGLDWLERNFGERALSFVMILFTYEREEECDTIIDDLKNNTILEQLMKKCGDRYCTCSKNMSSPSEMITLLQKIDDLISENNQCCYMAEIYNTGLKFREHQQDRGRHRHDHKVQLPDEDEESFATRKGADEHRKGQASGCEGNQSRDGQNQNKEEDKLRKENIRQLFSRLNLDTQHTLKIGEFLKITASSLKCHELCAEKDLVHTFLHRLIMMDYTARYIRLRQVTKINIQRNDKKSKDILSLLFDSEPVGSRAVEQFHVHPMDIQMAVFHCADNFLRQLMVTKLSQCQYAVPLLVPNPTTGEIEFPLWTFRQIKKSWKSKDVKGNTTSNCRSIVGVETPMVAFLRLGSVSSSKSQLMNNLINDRHHTFFDRNCPQDSKTRLLMNGVVEIAWYCPSGKNSDWLPDCVAFCNFHGDAGTNTIQREIVTKWSTVNVLVSTLSKDESKRTIIEELFKSTKPLIFLLTDSDSAGEELCEGKYRIGLKDRSQSDVTEELRKTIKECIKSSTFKLENVATEPNIVVDEEKGDCQRAKEAANQLMSLFNDENLTKIKEKYLPCQGKLWHDWCQENKKLYRLTGHLENHKMSIKQEMNKIRNQQHKLDVSCLLKLFLEKLNALTENEKVYFLKWVGMLLDSCTSDCLSWLHHEYNEQWSRVLDLKKKHIMSPSFSAQQAKLEKISKDLNAATFGVEHILREMGQVFEACMSVQNTELTNEAKLSFSCLPQIAAEIIVTGYPLEIMDGDAAHIPLIWVSAVLDELVKILGDQRVFVLSVLGIQSSGKSTMLNAMFGLQFAVSAGRCTRGAFMQLVRVSEEMKKELKFDYILVVDTEGLRALEQAEKTTIHHDNELATFVVGLGNLTLINIFGENPAEMQDILQIVVQAFLRMKKVRLYPSCLFVHQNVGDITAGEKTMEGRRRLQEKLDDMTKLASKEEDCDAQCFSDIITFDVQNDVRYFAQLWEGSPPMAPPNPSYSENVDELRRTILSKISTNYGVTLSQFKSSISDLWNALLNENFVFSFRNTLEIAVYRKLEHEYTKWTWSLRSTMLTVENKLLNRVNNERLLRIEEKDLVAEMRELKKEVDKAVDHFFREDRDKDILIQWQERFERKITDLYSELVEVAKRKLDHIYQQKIAREKVDEEKTRYENKLFKLSKELALDLKNNQMDINALRNKFDDVWSIWLSEVTQDAPMVGDIDVFGDVTKILSETYELAFVCDQQTLGNYKKLDVLGDYSDYVIFKKSQAPLPTEEYRTGVDVHETDKPGLWHRARTIVSNAYNSLLPGKYQPEKTSTTNKLTSKDNDQLRAFVNNVFQQSKNEIQRLSSAELGYNHSYIQQIIESVKTSINAHQKKMTGYILKKEFTVDLCLHVCTFAVDQFTKLHMKFKEANNVRLYLKKQKPQYFNIFKNYYNGASSAAVFGEFIVDKLEPSILQAAYDQTAIDVAEKMKCNVPAFSGNRSNLEKHILTSLAEDEDFENYIEYIHKPKEHFNHFITKEVNQYILTDKGEEVLETIKTNIKSKTKCVMDAVNRATEDVSKKNGDIDMWLENFSKELKDELQFKEESCPEQKEITDLGFLQELANKGLTDTMEKLCSEFKTISDLKQEMFRKKPNEILIEHLCRCCWVQCPFCNAICTNTMEDHDGDHRVRFHRNCGVNGWSFMFSENLGVDFCTTAVSSNMFFRTSAGVFAFKEYRKAGGDYAKWNISPDNSEMPYWKWFVCRFQEDLEKHYKRKFTGNGVIPHEWKEITRARAIESLSES
ncbi:interferon-induced very large GTPase 1-like isoform X2 [Neoarius graeffei]|nr:interferon-induced very large GTPase 1-like isoform X2 [Neoarius graeffei]XP_060760126.1 interferon-induced very large GTPase 1-like isoform X2 [Neoarius graeffei]